MEQDKRSVELKLIYHGRKEWMKGYFIGVIVGAAGSFMAVFLGLLFGYITGRFLS